MVIARAAVAILLSALFATTAPSARAETPEEWIALGTRIHGGFGPFIPLGIRIGLDSLTRLKAEPRTVAVTYYSGEKAPCPCIADGVMIATQASPGQGTLQVMAEKAPPGILASIVVRERKGSAARALHRQGRVAAEDRRMAPHPGSDGPLPGRHGGGGHLPGEPGAGAAMIA